MYITVVVEKTEGFTLKNCNYYSVYTLCNGYSTFRRVSKAEADRIAAKLMKMSDATYEMNTNRFTTAICEKIYRVRRCVPKEA